MIEDELKAIRRITAALDGMSQSTRNRIMRYVFDAEADREAEATDAAMASMCTPSRPPTQCREPELDAD